VSRLRPVRVVVLGVLIGGCSSYVTPYPVGWAALNDAARGCHAIAGTYAQRGERGPGGRSGEQDPRLTWLATGKEVPGTAGSVASVSFPEDDVFEIKAGDAQRWRFSEGTVSCRGSRVELRRSALGKSWLGPTWHFETVSLGKSHDGWLIAEHEDITWALLLFIPGRERAVDWYRYPPVNAPSLNRR
jgi:hypothetical protein